MYSVWLPVLGRFSGHVPPVLPEMEPPDWTSSGMEMSTMPWPPVWEPEMPIRP